MSKFVLTAQLQLQAPNNVGQVVNQIQSQLKGVNVNIQAQTAAKAQQQVNNLSSALTDADKSAQKLGNSFNVSLRRFTALAVATRAVSLFTNTLGNAVRSAIDFERELIKISQVTGKSMQDLKGLTQEITRLSTSFGVASESILGVSRILSQAGLSARETKIALDALAKSELAPTFDNITQTAEGAVAIFNQFKKGAGALEGQLGSLNAVAGQFAVESGDLIATIRRTGGVFKQAGGDLNELIALFTSVRSTTRESAESIATGLRTIFTRIQRPQTIEYLKKFGVELVDLEGKFIGPYRAVGELNRALAGLQEGDITFVEIAEQLGGFRQIGKVLPLIKEYAVAQEALKVAQEGSNSLAGDAAKAQASLAVRIVKVKEEFLALIRGISETSTFQTMANSALNLASAMIKIAEAVKPLLPILATLATIRLAKGLSGFLGGVMGGGGGGGGGAIRGFNSGGIVPGSGNTDTVPAMLTPGEFVIKKSSVGKLGASNLAAMNSNKYAKGGIVVDPNQVGGFFLQPSQGIDRTIGISGKGEITNLNVLKKLGYQTPDRGTDEDFFFASSPAQKANMLGRTKSNTFLHNMSQKGTVADQKRFLAEKRKSTNKNDQTAVQNFDRDYANSKDKVSKIKNTGMARTIPISGSIAGFFPGASGSINSSVASMVNEQTSVALKSATNAAAIDVNKTLDNVRPEFDLNDGMLKAAADRISQDANALATTSGFVFEGIIDAITGAKLQGDKSRWDFKGDLMAKKEGLSKMFASDSSAFSGMLKADAKRSNTPKSIASIVKKIVNDINANDQSGYTFQKFASGGAATGTDTVPAMLTPGEFVVNKKTSQSIGYDNLNQMNKVGKYAAGGIVTSRRNTYGPKTASKPATFSGAVSSGPSGASTQITTSIESWNEAVNEGTKTVKDNTDVRKKGLVGFGAMNEGLIATSMALSFMTPVIDENSSSLERFGANMISSFSQLANVSLALSGTFSLLQTQMKGNIIADMFKGLNLKDMGKFLGGGGKLVNRAGTAARAVGTKAGLGAANAEGVVVATRAVASMAGPAIVATGSIFALTAVIDSLTDRATKLDNAIKDGNAAAAESIAFEKEGASAVNKLAIGFAAIGSFIPGIGPIFAGLTAAAIKLGSELPILGPMIKTTAMSLGYWMGGKSITTIKLEAGARAQAVKTQEALTNANKEATAAMRQFKEGNLSAIDAMKRLDPDAATVQASADRSSARVKSIEENDKSGPVSGFGRGFARVATFGVAGMMGMESGGQRNERLSKDQEAIKADQDKVDKDFLRSSQPLTDNVMRQTANTNGSFEQYKNSLSKDTREAMERQGQFDKREDPETGEMTKDSIQMEAFENLKKEADRVRESFAAMNLAMQSATAAANAGVLAIDNYTRSQELGSNTLDSTIPTLEASITSAAQGISPDQFNSSLDNASKTLENLGANSEQIDKFRGNLTAVNAAQANMPAIFEATKKSMKEAFKSGRQAAGTMGERRSAFANATGDALTKQGVDEKSVERLKKQIEGSDISDDQMKRVSEGDFSAFEEVIQKVGDNAMKQVLPALKAQAEAQKKLLTFTKARLDLEKKLIETKQRSIDLETEALKIQSEFGGASFTPEVQQQQLLKRSNVGVEGIKGVGSQSGIGAGDFKSRIDQLSNRRAEISSVRTDLAEGKSNEQARGKSGVEMSDELGRIDSALKEEYNSIKAAIDIRKQELSIIKEKNANEKAAADALIAGDDEAFFDKMGTAGAQAAIATGDKSLMNQFGPQALGMAAQENRRLQESGVDSLYGQKLSGPDGLTERSFGASFGAMGVDAPDLAKIAAGSTNEEAAKESEIRELAGVLPDLGKAMVDAAARDLEIAQKQEDAAQKQYDAAVLRTKEAMNAGEEAKNTAEVNTKVANINTDKVSESGDAASTGAKDGAGGAGGAGGGGIIGAIKGIFGMGGGAVANAGNMAKNAIGMGKNFVQSGGAGNLASRIGTEGGEILSRVGSRIGQTGIGKNFTAGRSLTRSVMGGVDNVPRPAGIMQKAGGMFERLNQASYGDDFAPSMMKRGQNLLNAGKNKAGSFFGDMATSFGVGKHGYGLEGMSRSGKPGVVNRASNFAGQTMRKVGQSQFGQKAAQFGSNLYQKGSNFLGGARNMAGNMGGGLMEMAEKNAPGLMQKGRNAIGAGKNFFQNTAPQMMNASSQYLQKNAPGMLQSGKKMLQQGTEFVGSKMGNLSKMKIPGLDKIGPSIMKSLSKLPMLGKMASSGAKGIPGLGTALDGIMEAGSFISDPKAYHEDKKEKTGRDFGGMMDSWGVGFLKTGTQFDAALATVLGGLEGFLNPVGKIVEGFYNIVGGAGDLVTLVKSSLDVAAAEERTSASMSETSNKRAAAVGLEGGTESFEKLGALDKSAANQRANMLFRRNEANAAGGDRSKFLSSTGMSEEDFTNTYGKDASMKDVKEQEQQMIDTDIKGRQDTRNRESYFYGSGESSDFDKGVKEQLAIRQAEKDQAASTPEATSATESQAESQKQAAEATKEVAKETKEVKEQQSKSPSTSTSVAAPTQRAAEAQAGVASGAGLDPEVMERFSSALSKFNTDLSANIDRLENTSIKITLDNTNVSVNINDGGILARLENLMGNVVKQKVVEELSKTSRNPDGSPRQTDSKMG